MGRYIKLDRPIKEIPADELKQLLKNTKDSELMRTIILNEKEFINVNYNRSLRGFWYSTVKPTLDKLGLLTEYDSTEESLKKWDAELSRYVAELVKSGQLTYRDLRIEDVSRKRSIPFGDYYGHKAPYPNLIIATEKDTIYDIISDIANFFGCSCISGKGQNSLGAMESLLRSIKLSEEVYYGTYIKPIYILTMTDYDPAGYYIADTFKNQIEDLKSSLKIESEIYIERIGIIPQQLTPEEVEQNKYTPKLVNREKWFKATGGINGEPKGLELDALSPDRIRSIFVTSIKKYVEENTYKEFLREEWLRNYVMEIIRPKVDDIVDDVVDDVVNAELESVEIVDFDLFSYAKKGYSTLPVADLCNTTRKEQIKELTLSYFNI